MQDRKRQLEEATMPPTPSPKRLCKEVEESCSQQQNHDGCLNPQAPVSATPLTEEALRHHEEALTALEDEWAAPPTLSITESGAEWRYPKPDEHFEAYYEKTFIFVRTSTEECFRVTFPERVDINTLRSIDTSALDLTSVAADDIMFKFASFVADIYGLDIDSMISTYIPGHHMWPRFRSSLTAVPEKMLQYCHVKQGAVAQYKVEKKGRYIKDLILAEAEICEHLMDHPHLNIAKYWGCDVVDDRIRGLCFGKYTMTLFERAELGIPLDHEHCLRGIRDGLDHLHSLGFAHNDINPHNIMLDAGDNAIIIDFDSCKPIGETMIKGGTPDWCVENSWISSPENDFYGLNKIAEHFAECREDEQKDEQGEEAENV
ncbi:serine threonine kinase [Fusarium heterosporum]|uniref:Serine threonine kinase n=1 Tax=Fusarium heterosporum TaxID=42747 RepID=A0A8H5TLT2_FUSHE|nr:serine threonine kinase [Fusarium heterosporum]